MERIGKLYTGFKRRCALITKKVHIVTLSNFVIEYDDCDLKFKEIYLKCKRGDKQEKTQKIYWNPPGPEVGGNKITFAQAYVQESCFYSSQKGL